MEEREGINAHKQDEASEKHEGDRSGLGRKKMPLQLTEIWEADELSGKAMMHAAAILSSTRLDGKGMKTFSLNGFQFQLSVK